MENEERDVEKRTKVRIPFIYGIEFEQAEDSMLSSKDFFRDQDTNIIIKDISVDGIQIISHKFIPKGTEVKLILRFPRLRSIPKGFVEDIDCAIYALVKWIDKDKTGKGFCAGLYFTKFIENAKEVISKYLDDNISIEEDEMS